MSGRDDSPLAPEQIAAVNDEDIDFSDIPELDEDFWKRAELVEPDRTLAMVCRQRYPRIWIHPVQDQTRAGRLDHGPAVRRDPNRPHFVGVVQRRYVIGPERGVPLQRTHHRSNRFPVGRVEPTVGLHEVDRDCDAAKVTHLGVGQVRILRHLAARKFGRETAEELARLLVRTPDEERIGRVAAAIVDCDAADDFLARVLGNG